MVTGRTRESHLDLLPRHLFFFLLFSRQPIILLQYLIRAHGLEWSCLLARASALGEILTADDLGQLHLLGQCSLRLVINQGAYLVPDRFDQGFCFLGNLIFVPIIALTIMADEVEIGEKLLLVAVVVVD